MVEYLAIRIALLEDIRKELGKLKSGASLGYTDGDYKTCGCNLILAKAVELSNEDQRLTLQVPTYLSTFIL